MVLVARGASVSCEPQAILRRSHVCSQVHAFRTRRPDCRIDVWLVSKPLPARLISVVAVGGQVQCQTV
jgi:hypothetical protein